MTIEELRKKLHERINVVGDCAYLTNREDADLFGLRFGR